MEKLDALYDAKDGRPFSDTASKSNRFNELLDVSRGVLMFKSNSTNYVRTSDSRD